jgi:rubrerythrin
MIAPFIEDSETRTHLETIIAEENRHISRLRDFIVKSEAAAMPAR